MTEPTLQRLRNAFLANFDQRGEIGASLSLWQQGEELLSLHAGVADVKTGTPWTERTLIPIYSATKPASAAAFLLALHRAGMSPECSVGEIWPRFPAPYLSIGDVMSHQAGLAALSRQASIFDLDDCIAAIEQTRPAWLPPQHGYHPHTYGPILDALMRFLTGKRIGEYWEEEIRRPLNLDFYIGLPEAEFYRVGVLYPGRADASRLHSPFYEQYLHSGTAIYRAFNSITGLGSVHLMNMPRAWTSASPSSGGVASARGLAMFYQALLGYGHARVFPDDVLAWLATPLVQGDDLTLLEETSFSCGAMCDPLQPDGTPARRLYGDHGFGHTGAGGAHGFAEPRSGISMGYTMNAMEMSVLPGKKTTALAHAVLLGSDPTGL